MVAFIIIRLLDIKPQSFTVSVSSSTGNTSSNEQILTNFYTEKLPWLRLFENMVLRRILWSKRGEETREWRKLHIEEPTQPTIRLVPGLLSWSAKWQEREDYYSSASNAEVKNECNCMFIPSIRLRSMQKNNFTLN